MITKKSIDSAFVHEKDIQEANRDTNNSIIHFLRRCFQPFSTPSGTISVECSSTIDTNPLFTVSGLLFPVDQTDTNITFGTGTPYEFTVGYNTKIDNNSCDLITNAYSYLLPYHMLTKMVDVINQTGTQWKTAIKTADKKGIAIPIETFREMSKHMLMVPMGVKYTTEDRNKWVLEFLQKMTTITVDDISALNPVFRWYDKIVPIEFLGNGFTVHTNPEAAMSHSLTIEFNAPLDLEKCLLALANIIINLK